MSEVDEGSGCSALPQAIAKRMAATFEDEGWMPPVRLPVGEDRCSRNAERNRGAANPYCLPYSYLS